MNVSITGSFTGILSDDISPVQNEYTQYNKSNANRIQIHGNVR